MNPRYQSVAQRAGSRCEYCRAPELVFNFAFDVEHIVPRSSGGPDEMSNLALSCESCNTFKSDTLTVWDAGEGESVPLFNPRRHRWDEHFRVNGETAEIEGLTAIGRITVNQLRMNSAFQLRARLHWMRLGLFP